MKMRTQFLTDASPPWVASGFPAAIARWLSMSVAANLELQQLRRS
jgi:hypothetical protein